MTQAPHRPPVLDMTPEGEFRDTPQAVPRGTWLDRTLLRLGGAAVLAAFVAGGLILAASAVLLLGLLIPVVIVAGLVGFATLWWRARRAGGRPRGGPGMPAFVIIRR
ncbi:hypothetical protein [Roseomonas populi]|uniref:Uncharacterized protein n=1 Tax=Roseomonas populi TaxID=3121582 RepID=A0ABT1X0H2_9PROT|nr:hypothetical protein [Roseomonas pecuniae]MCR0981286.1 hypothetical protein [Roseomonas pecuniae]